MMMKMTSLQAYGPLPVHDHEHHEGEYDHHHPTKNNHYDESSTSLSSPWDDSPSPIDLEVFEIGTIGSDDEFEDQRDDDDGGMISTTTQGMSRHHHHRLPSSHPPQHLSPQGHDHKRQHLLLRLPTTTYYCPLTLNLMKDPVLDRCGHCFDRDAITTWLQVHEMCPISRKPLHPQDLMEAVALKERIEQWKEGRSSVVAANNATSVGSAGGDVERGMSSSEPEGSQTPSHPDDSSSHYSPLELMLLPQERKVLSMIQFQERLRIQRERYSRCVWALVYAITLALLSIAFATIYSFHVTLRAPL
jgi:U-box domain